MTASYPLSVDLLHSDGLSGWNDFMLAVRQNDVTFMQQYMETLTSAQMEAAFQVAVALNKHDAMECLLGNVKQGFHTALWVAANNGYIDCLNTLLKDPRAQQDMSSSLALSSAIEGGNDECIAAMLKQNYPQDYDYSAAFYAALRYGRMDAARALSGRCDIHQVYAAFCDNDWDGRDPEVFSNAQEIMAVLVSEVSKNELTELGLHAPSTSKPPKM